MLRISREAFTQPRILRRDARRTGVEVTDAHHDAADRHQRRGGEPELLGTEQRGDRDIASGLQLPIGLDRDAAAQVVEHEGLVRLGQPQLPRQARVRGRGERRSAGAAVVAADQHHIGMRLGDARSDGADADLGHQLHADARCTVGVLQVVDQFCEVLDGIDVVVRRRRDEPHTRRGVPRLGDPGIDLGARKLPAFARLGALRHLDLDLLGAHQVLAGDTEAARGDLLDRRIL